MTIDELCDAINEAKIVNFADVKEAVEGMLFDLGKMVSELDQLFYIECNSTRSPYLDPNMNALIFSDQYFADKFVDARSDLNVTCKPVQGSLESFFVYLLTCGVDYVEFCSGSKGIHLKIDEHIFKGIRGRNANSPTFSKYLIMTAQVVRSGTKTDNHDRLVDLLMKNVISEAADAVVLVPINIEVPANIKSVNGQVLQNIPENVPYTISTARDKDNNLLFPVFTSIFEFASSPFGNALCIATPLKRYVQFVKDQVDAKLASGIICNSATVSLLWDKATIDSFAESFELLS